MTDAPWRHKDLLDTEHLTKEEIYTLLATAEQFQEINTRPVKKVPTLRGKGIILFFAEDSTRTKTSFDVAGKRLSADTFSLGKSGSSLNKGESLKDTALTLQAMSPDIIVIRHSSSGAAQFLAERLPCSVINAGDGWHAHPTQALLDAYTLWQHWKKSSKTASSLSVAEREQKLAADEHLTTASKQAVPLGEGLDGMRGKSLLIAGDIAHSRVARSNIHLLTKLGVQVRIFAPRTLLPANIETWPVQIYTDFHAALDGVNAVMCLRLQLERQQAGLLPGLSEYASQFCLTRKRLDLADPLAPVLHPGPINRGLEIAADVADSPQSRILDQVSAGVALRMAVLFTLGTRNE